MTVLIASTGTLLLITLTFGSTSDWCRNVLEAGGCRVKLRGVEYSANEPQVVDDLTAADEVAPTRVSRAPSRGLIGRNGLSAQTASNAPTASIA